MDNTSTKNLILKLCGIFFVLTLNACGSGEKPSSTVESLTKTSVRLPECGVESYNALTNSSCGVDNYVSARSEACGVELYNERASSKCPGYRREERYGRSNEARLNRYPDCDSPDHRVVKQYIEERCFRGECGPYKYFTECVIPEVVESCRDSEFGIELYNECRHPSHGVETYQTCQRPEFGVNQYNACSVYMTRPEINQFVVDTTGTVPIITTSLITNHGNYFVLVRTELGIACLINKYQNNPDYSSVVSDLRLKLLITFGIEYDKKAADYKEQCKNPTNIPDITKEKCSENDETPLCRTVKAYLGCITWFTDKISDTDLLLGDIFANSYADIKTKLVDFKTNLSNKLNNNR